MYPHKQKSKRVKAGERGGQAWARDDILRRIMDDVAHIWNNQERIWKATRAVLKQVLLFVANAWGCLEQQAA